MHYDEQRENAMNRIPEGLEVKGRGGWLSVLYVTHRYVSYDVNGSIWIQRTDCAKFRIMGKEGKTVKVD